MANLRDIRNRIRAVKNTGKITRAMQLVAASKMKRAQDHALQGRAYAELLARLLATLQERQPDYQHPFLQERDVKVRGVLVISSDRGLAGPLNSNLFREIGELPKDTQFFSIGRKAKQFIARTKRNLVASFEVTEEARYSELRPVVEMMIDLYKQGEIDTVEVLYPRFKNTLVQEPTLETFLPLDRFEAQLKETLEQAGETLVEDVRDITFEPSPDKILEQLLDRFIKREIYQRLLDARASEHSARMVAMKAATDNAKKLQDSLTLQYNKARQAAITQEILEITAAASS
ncbi:MAG: F-type H+-transporting ATPase subunit gamma [Puniceicoccaceae bacterium 5H]|nr:MAG: F-type H+-transporting ATPase subunit gamma [Puniceicoccaceae bacterium 5H]